ncbi:MAG TPA: hypothetical protein PK495_07815, partial [Bacteroidales bacterium]|nr:hypothetical protein [Bacteroidales bacterium]
RLKKKKYTVRIVYCTPKQARYLERALIVKHKPRDNSVKYALYNQDYTKAEIKYEQNVIDTYEELEVSPDYNYGLPF